jgi:BCD family chlorophyll transporter-like MFS transporter
MTLSWLSILRLGLVQMALGAIVVLTTSLLNRLMVVELALPAVLPGALVALHYGIQITRPNWGFRSDTGGHRRAAAATITWLMMIFGIAMTAGVVGSFLDPYSPAVLLRLVLIVVLAALALTCLAVWGIERHVIARPEPESPPFLEGLAEIWAEQRARHFTIFVFLSMVAYFMQELILEPYAGLVFGFTPGQSTTLSGAQNGGVFVGMLTVGILASGFKIGSLRNWVMAGCMGSAVSLTIITIIGQIGPGAPLLHATVLLGYFNGMFAVAAIGSMMALAGQGRETREGTRMGLWGAAQAVAAGFGGLAWCSRR